MRLLVTVGNTVYASHITKPDTTIQIDHAHEHDYYAYFTHVNIIFQQDCNHNTAIYAILTYLHCYITHLQITCPPVHITSILFRAITRMNSLEELDLDELHLANRTGDYILMAADTSLSLRQVQIKHAIGTNCTNKRIFEFINTLSKMSFTALYMLSVPLTTDRVMKLLNIHCLETLCIPHLDSVYATQQHCEFVANYDLQKNMTIRKYRQVRIIYMPRSPAYVENCKLLDKN